MITVKVDTRGVEAKLNNAEKEIQKTLLNEVTRWAINTDRDARQLAPIDEGFLRRSIQAVPATIENGKIKGSVVVAANYAAYIEFGTRAFAAAYVASLPSNWQQYAATFRGKTGLTYSDFIFRLMGWMKRKGIDESAAYVIARKILRNGIRPHPFLFPSVQKNLIELKNRLK